eukprot:Gb_18386 [translate_table: standard]
MEELCRTSIATGIVVTISAILTSDKVVPTSIPLPRQTVVVILSRCYRKGKLNLKLQVSGLNIGTKKCEQGARQPRLPVEKERLMKGKTMKIEPLDIKPPIKGTNGMASSTTLVMVQGTNLLIEISYDGSSDMVEIKGITMEDELKRRFMLTLRGATRQWYTSADRSQVSWDKLKRAFLDRFQVLRDVGIIIQELMYARQMHGESIRDYEG